MATGRTLVRWTRVYADGFDLSGYGRSIGPLTAAFGGVDLTAAMGDEVRGVLPDIPSITPGPFNAVLDNTEDVGSHEVLSTAGGFRNLMVPIGIRAAPVAGDPVFCGRFEQLNYMANEDAGAIVANVQFGNWDVSGLINYTKPWGVLLHAKAAKTAVNTAVGIDDAGAATAAGGWLMYQVFAGDGTATIKVQDAATNSNANFADLTGATTGVIDCSTPAGGIVAISETATVRRYLRWQIVLGTATTVTFALAFIRA